jgi:hypothetical protein
MVSAVDRAVEALKRRCGGGTEYHSDGAVSVSFRFPYARDATNFTDALAALRAEQERAQERMETTAEERAVWNSPAPDNLFPPVDAVAEEREACAQIADEKRDNGLNADLLSEPPLWVDGYEHGCRDVAAAIRARSEPKTGGAA